MDKRTVCIGGASGFWGDSSESVSQLLGHPELDYLTFDYLAELTMSIMARARSKNPEAGFATDFVSPCMSNVLQEIAERDIKVLSNAGGVNPRACAAQLKRVAEAQGLSLKIAVVLGDDCMSLLGDMREQAVTDLHSGEPLPSEAMSSNAYLGAMPIAKALELGAQVVITGRCVDSALPLAALIHEFGWTAEQYNELAAGSLAGHLIECGPQCTGGLYTDWQEVNGWENMGYPVVECDEGGSFVVTKVSGTGGLVTPATVAEQMLYEIGDPGAYLLPDVSCDLTAVEMHEAGLDRVLVTGVRGHAPSDSYKVSTTYQDGWRSVANITLIGGDAIAKARRVAETLLARTRSLMASKGFADYRAVHSEILGSEAVFGSHSRIQRNREVTLRLVVEHEDRNALGVFAAEIAPAATSWAPGLASIGGGRPSATPIVKMFSSLWPKDALQVSVEIDNQHWTMTPEAVHNDTSYSGRSTYTATPSPSKDARTEVPLLAIAHGRSGDKGDSVNIGIIARDECWLGVLREQVTAERVGAYFAHLLEGDVTRFDVPGINGFNFLLTRALGGGGMASPRIDPLGKAYAQMLLDLSVSVPTDLLPRARLSPPGPIDN